MEDFDFFKVDFDLSELAISKENTIYDVKAEPETESDKMATDKPKEIKEFGLPKDLPALWDRGSPDAPLILKFTDGTEEMTWLPFDQYFQIIDRLWNHPLYGTNADLVTMEKKMEDAAPYNLFFTTLKHCPETEEQPYSIKFADLLCPSFGKLKCSFHMTLRANIRWILTQFARRKLHKLPMTIIHGFEGYAWPKKETMEKLYPNIDYHYIPMKKKETDLGCHDTKLSIFVYEDDSLRVVIGTASLYTEHWELQNQQVWISPPCPRLPEGSSVMSGESPTGFKFALLDYLFSYDKYDIPSMRDWIARIKNADFSEVKVALLFSVPGVHFPRKNGSFLHFLGHLLSRDCTIPAPKEELDSWRVIVQTASLGLVGKNPEEWLNTNFLKALESHKESPYLPTLRSVSKTQFNLIFPTIKNAFDGYFGPSSTLCGWYDPEVKQKQPWLLKYCCQWKADGTKRSRAMSHAKCYCRISPCWQKMAYYFLASANLSRSAWGKVPNLDTGIYIRSYELGILFLPKYFGEEYFEVQDCPNRKNKRLFPIMFDLPLTPYGPNDDSYCGEELTEKGLLPDLKFKKDGSGDDENDSPKDGAVKSSDKDKNEIDFKKSNDLLLRKLDRADNKSEELGESQKKDTPVSIKQRTDLFFPSFSKNS